LGGSDRRADLRTDKGSHLNHIFMLRGSLDGWPWPAVGPLIFFE